MKFLRMAEKQFVNVRTGKFSKKVTTVEWLQCPALSSGRELRTAGQLENEWDRWEGRGGREGEETRRACHLHCTQNIITTERI